MHRAVGTYSPSDRYSVPKLASQIRTAFSSMAWNTGSSSPGELDDAQHLRCGFLSLQRLVALTGELSNVGLCFVVGRGWIA